MSFSAAVPEGHDSAIGEMFCEEMAVVAHGGTDHGCHDGHAVPCGALMLCFRCLSLPFMLPVSNVLP